MHVPLSACLFIQAGEQIDVEVVDPRGKALARGRVGLVRGAPVRFGRRARSDGAEARQGAGRALRLLLVSVEVEVFGARCEALWREKHRLDPCTRGLLCGHAVPFDEADRCEGRGSEDADPGEFFDPQVGVEAEVERDCDRAGGRGEEALAKRHAEEDGLGVIANLAVDLDFQNEASLFGCRRG